MYVRCGGVVVVAVSVVDVVVGEEEEGSEGVGMGEWRTNMLEGCRRSFWTPEGAM